MPLLLTRPFHFICPDVHTSFAHYVYAHEYIMRALVICAFPYLHSFTLDLQTSGQHSVDGWRKGPALRLWRCRPGDDELSETKFVCWYALLDGPRGNRSRSGIRPKGKIERIEQANGSLHTASLSFSSAVPLHNDFAQNIDVHITCFTLGGYLVAGNYNIWDSHREPAFCRPGSHEGCDHDPKIATCTIGGRLVSCNEGVCRTLFTWGPEAGMRLRYRIIGSRACVGND